MVSEPASSSQSPLVRLIDKANEPKTTRGSELLRSLTDWEGTAASTARSRSRARSPHRDEDSAAATLAWEDFDEVRSFWADERMSSPEISKWYRKESVLGKGEE